MPVADDLGDLRPVLGALLFLRVDAFSVLARFR
jgi:hypothetical protein